MTPQPSTIAHYCLTAKLGEGGMGAVYEATDTKLNRQVAIKLLPDSFAADPDRLARFTREAQLLAQLNHPNIAAIYGVEERALILELIEGPTLAGPLPIDEALPLIHQLIDALEYAHDKGIVHRDLKPANLKLTADRRLKVLDFGLAKALTADSPASSNVANSPTLTMRATMAGVIMGTAAYMSPEQARGHAADRRSDIWSFGVVVYEILTGKPLFDASTVSDILALVLTKNPEFSAIPARFHRLLKLCLTRDPRARLSHISAARLLLDEPEASAPPAPAGRTSKLPWVAAGALALLAAGLGIVAFRPRPAPAFVRLETILSGVRPWRTQNTSMLAIAPDGARLAVVDLAPDGKVRLGVRRLDEQQFTSIPETDGANAPFFSPDGQWLGFTANEEMYKVSLQGGAPVRLGDLSTGRGASWYGDWIYAAPSSRSPIYRIAAAGGRPEPVTQLRDAEVTHRWPWVLPGGKAMLFTSHVGADVGGFDEAKVEAFEFAGSRRRVLVNGGFGAKFLPSSGTSGYLLYMQRNTVFAAPFDAAALSLTGPAFPAIPDVESSARGGGDYDVATSGTVVYREGHTSRGWSIYLGDASGKLQPLHSAPGNYFSPTLSPDGKRLAFGIATGKGGDLWLKDVDRDAATRLTNLPGSNNWFVWSPDGRGIYFAHDSTVYWVTADGSAPPLPFGDDPVLKDKTVPTSITTDGKRLIVQHEVGPRDRHPNLFSIPISGDPSHPQAGKPEPYLPSTFNQTYARVSPDGRWLSYTGNDTGASEIYVSAYPTPSGRVQVSSGGGRLPQWSRTARELFYRDNDQHIQVVPYTVDAAGFHPGKPRLWSDVRLMDLTNLINADLAPDGKHFALIPAVAPGESEKPQNTLMFLLNFPTELARRASEQK